MTSSRCTLSQKTASSSRHAILMTMQKTIIGTGIFNLDTIVVREYPEWPAMRPFVEKEVLQEVGGTCGNVMCMLATMGWKVRPVACLDDSVEGLKITEDLKSFGCDCTYVSNTPGSKGMFQR